MSLIYLLAAESMSFNFTYKLVVNRAVKPSSRETRAENPVSGTQEDLK